VVVPDLEQIVLGYLYSLDESLRGSRQWQHNYEWMMLELYDQAVRESSGGAMAAYLRTGSVPNPEFILGRIGVEGKCLMENDIPDHLTHSANRKKLIRRLVRAVHRPSRIGTTIRDLILRSVLGKEDFHYLQVGRFRHSGQIHLWMYDRYSLATSLREAGFVRVRQCTPFQSAIIGWPQFQLDVEPDGSIYKPDSLYMEATKD
jgi:hypothetical protein